MDGTVRAGDLAGVCGIFVGDPSPIDSGPMRTAPPLGFPDGPLCGLLRRRVCRHRGAENMNLGVLLSRRTYLKTFGPVMSEALLRGHTVTVILDQTGQKPGEDLSPGDLSPWPRLQWRSATSPPLDVLVGQQYTLPDHGCPYYYLGQYYDNLGVRPPATYTMCYLSEYHWKLHYALYGMQTSPPPIVGFLAGDHLPLIVGEEVMRAYRLPKDRPIWLFFPPKAPTEQYRRIVQSFLTRAKRENAYVVVKYRFKSYRPWYAYFVGHRRVWDDSMYPHTSVVLTSIADKVIHFDSGAGYEAAYCGVFAVSVGLDRPPAWPTAYIEYSHLPGSRLQWPGVNIAVPAREAVEFLRDGDWPSQTVRATDRESYIEKFLGFSDHRSAERVLDVLEYACETADRSA